MKTEKEIFILDATIKRPDGTVEQLTKEEALAYFYPDEYPRHVLNGDVTISWIEYDPEHIELLLCMWGIEQ